MNKITANCTFLIVLMFSILSFVPVLAATDDVRRITIQELKKLMDDKADVTILDAQPKRAFEKGHIRGAISFPWAPKLNENHVAALPKTGTLVIYCDCGPGETDSVSVAEKLIDLGFSDVKVLKDPSIRGWKEAGYPVE